MTRILRDAWIALSGLVCVLGAGIAAPAQEPAGPEITEGIVKAPPAEIWKVFSTAEGFKKLGVAQCDLDLRVGGLIRTHYNAAGKLGDDGTIFNEILAYEPERMIAIRVQKPPKGFPFSEATWKGTWSVITLGDLGDGRTHVRIAGLGYTDSEESRKMRDFFRAGNRWVVDFLVKEYDARAPAPKGEAHPASTLAPIVIDQSIDLPRATVWELFSTSEGWKRFFGAASRIELRPGGPWELLFDPKAPAGSQGSEGCTVLSFLPQRMLSFTWNAPPKFAHARERRTWVVVQFDEVAPAKTRVRLEHHGFAEQAEVNPEHRAEWEDVRSYFAKAWPRVLGALEGQQSKR